MSSSDRSLGRRIPTDKIMLHSRDICRSYRQLQQTYILGLQILWEGAQICDPILYILVTMV